jgi:hypothetical protein
MEKLANLSRIFRWWVTITNEWQNDGFRFIKFYFNCKLFIKINNSY